MIRVDWNKHSNYLIPIDLSKNKANVEWVCCCSVCQCERTLSYEQALNIAKGKYDRDCLPCKIEKGTYVPNIDGLRFGRKNNQEGKVVKRPSNARVFQYLQLFNPQIWDNDEVREKQRAAKLGKVGPLASRWEGGKTEERKLLRNRDEYKQLRRLVFKRDNFTCQICLKRSDGNLEMDHIKEWSNYPELRFNPDNCRTLCIDCHKKTDNYGHKAVKLRCLIK